MLSLELLKNQIKDLVETASDAELLDLVYKLLLTQCCDNGL